MRLEREIGGRGPSGNGGATIDSPHLFKCNGGDSACGMPSDNQDSERSLLTAALHRVAKGDRPAFHEVYRRTCAKLLGVCLRISTDREEAEEVLQEVYVTVWQKAAQFDAARASPITWLATMARNRAIDRLRAGGRRITAPVDAIEEVADESPSALDRMLEAEGEHSIATCIEELSKGDAVLIRTAFFEQATYAELAARADLPLGTVKSRIRRALIKLRGCLS